MNETFSNRKITLLIGMLWEMKNICKKQRFRKCNPGTTILNILRKSTGQEKNNILNAAS